MSAFENYQKNQRSIRSFEEKVIKLGMFVTLGFIAWLTHHFVQWALLGLRLFIP